MPRPTLFHAAWVLPVSSPPIRDGAVLVDEAGRIAEVGPRAAVPAPDDAERVELGEAALLPGLVNVHAHPELAAFRGLLDDLDFADWIPTLNAAKRGAGLGYEAYVDAGRWTCVEALAAGITTLAATEATGAALDAFRDAGVRGVVYREVFGPSPEQADASMAELRDAAHAMRRRETDLVRIGISPHAPYTVSDRLYRLAADFALEEELPVAVHAAEADAEDLLVREGEGRFADGLRARNIATQPRARSTVELLQRNGVLRTRPLVIHAVLVDQEDRRLLADSGSPVAHCPVANARLGHAVAPVREMLDAGIVVGIGTDSVASNNRLDLLEEARAAQMMQRSRLRDGTLLSAPELLRLATLDGARALGLEGRIGTLEAGKEADLCAVSLAGAHVVPAQDPVGALFYAARAGDVVLTAVRGRILYRDGRVLSLDAEAIRPRVAGAARALVDARDAWREARRIARPVVAVAPPDTGGLGGAAAGPRAEPPEAT